jgi:D-serine deaminase-like pyridoxal phosphate-dependent protein
MSASHGLDGEATPAALVDVARLDRNIARMQSRMDALGVRFRPHVKTTKCPEIVRRQLAAGASGITVSTLAEAEAFHAIGIDDILYAVGIAPAKLDRALALRRQGCALKLLTDNGDAARAVCDRARAEGASLELWIEVDADGHRAGLPADSDALLELGRSIARAGSTVGGVLTHAGSSYGLRDPHALRALAAREGEACVHAAERLRAAGLDCPNVSIGSTPTALSAERMPGVTEMRAGVYALLDLMMMNTGVCEPDDLALSVLTRVIGHQPARGRAIVDAGWMALSRDHGTQTQGADQGYGWICDTGGAVIEGLRVTACNQEHGIVEDVRGAQVDMVDRLPLGTLLRILPNHACATAAQFAEYRAVLGGEAIARWPRFRGW